MKNLIFVALLVSVMLVLTVGTAFAVDRDDYEKHADRNAGSTTVSVEAGGEAGGSGGLIVDADDGEIARFDNSSLRFRLD